MKTSIITLLFSIMLLCAHTAQARTVKEHFDDPCYKDKVLFCTNNNRVLTREQASKLDHMLIKSMDILPDTIKITLKGRSIPELQEQLEPAYRAEIKIGGKTCRYECDEIPAFVPKTSQYMISDTCFYLTFDIAPRFQTKGPGTWLSMFMALDSIPTKGRVYPLRPVSSLTGDSVVVEWDRTIGSVAAVQLALMPDKSHREVINATPSAPSTISVEEFRIHKSGLASIKLKFTITVTLPDNSTLPVNATIDLRQIQPTDLHPHIFEIDYDWAGMWS